MDAAAAPREPRAEAAELPPPVSTYFPLLGGLLPRPPPDGLPVRLGQFGFAGAGWPARQAICFDILMMVSDVVIGI